MANIEPMQAYLFVTEDGFVLATVSMTEECARRANDYLSEIYARGLYVAQKEFSGKAKSRKRRYVSNPH